MEGAGIVGRVHAVNEECWRIIGECLLPTEPCRGQELQAGLC
eukprot:COSAG03_NODE_105_length_12702_cov_43.786162_5_plen_42_part_00